VFGYFVKWLTWIDHLARWALGILVSLMVADVFAQVLWRYAFNDPIFWADEAARYMFVWISFLGAAVAFGEKLHYGFDYLTQKFPPGFQRTVEILVGALVGLFLALCIFKGFEASIIVMEQNSPALRIRMGWVYLALPAGSAIMLLHLIAQLIRRDEVVSKTAHVE
jgi:TRAP-type C4-dicarboxylate transport system permease small subunit